MSSSSPHPPISPGDHTAYLFYALTLASKSPPKPTNFCVGAVLVDADTNTIISTGYTLECPGNTHAEQCCFIKLAEKYSLQEDNATETGKREGESDDSSNLKYLGTRLPANTVLYTTMEPCSLRLSGSLPCTDRILLLNTTGKGIKTVYVGVQEPEKFVGENVGRRKLEDNGIEVVLVGGMEERILAVATAGHGEG